MKRQNDVSWSVRVEKKTYRLGERVRLLGRFKSLVDEQRNWNVHTLLNMADSEDFPEAIIPFLLKLDDRQEVEAVIREFIVSDEYPPGQYSIKIGLEIERGIMDFKEVIFRIEGTPKPLSVSTVVSRDMEGKNRTFVFSIEDKEAHILVKSEAKTLELSGICIYPSGEETIVEFIGNRASIQLLGEGKYQLRLRAAAKGYRMKIKVISFSVISQHPSFIGIDTIIKKKKKK